MSNPANVINDIYLELVSAYVDASEFYDNNPDTPADNFRNAAQFTNSLQTILTTLATAAIAGFTKAEFVSQLGTIAQGYAGAALIVEVGTQAYVAAEAYQDYLNGGDQRRAILEGYQLSAVIFVTIGAFAAGFPLVQVALIVGLMSFAIDQLTDPNSLLWTGADWLFDHIVSPLISLFGDPLTLDLDGDGIELIALNNPDGTPRSTVYFDLHGNGVAERTGWVAPDDGMLVHDINRNGTVDSVAELFGSATIDGFAVLETLDTNGDGKITAADEAFSELRVWRDLNQDGVSQANELFTLTELNITEISTQTTDATGTNQGHDLGLTSLFTRTNGTTGEATSVYFQTDGQDSVINETGFTPSAAARLLPQLPRSGNLHSTAYAATNDTSFAAKMTALVSGAATMNAGDLRGAFEAMLLDWAGADGVVESSRGAWTRSSLAA
jgi:hypothetical protein